MSNLPDPSDRRWRTVAALVDSIAPLDLKPEALLVVRAALGEAFDAGVTANRVEPSLERLAAPSAYDRIDAVAGFLAGLAARARQRRDRIALVTLEELIRALRAMGQPS